MSKKNLTEDAKKLKELRKNTVAQLMVQYLEDIGIKHIFGLCGHTNIAFLSALADSSIEFITTRHEQIAAHAADGYARVKNTPSVLLSHLTPGLTNAATGVMNAALDCIPMVVIAGDVPSHYYGKHPHQEINLHSDASQYEIYKPFVKRAWRVDHPNLIPEIMDKAFLLATSGQSGPVLINIPMDVFSKEIDPNLFHKQNGKKQINKPSIDYDIANKIVTALAEAKKPLLYVGGGILLSQASDKLQEFVNHMQIPVAHSLMGKGALLDNHELVLGMSGFWGTKIANDASIEADYILALGTRFKEADSSSWESGYTFNIPEKTKLFHIDIEPSEIGRNYPVEIGAIGDARQSLKILSEIAKEKYPNGFKRPKIIEKIKQYRENFKKSNLKQVTSDAFPMMPERILSELRELLPKDAIITTDVGWNKNGVGQQFDILTPGSILSPGGAATMGFGPSAALGAKLAAPDKLVVSIVGDGGFGQNPAVLSSAIERNMHIIWIVMNNNAFGTIAGLQMAHYGLNYGTIFEKEQTQGSYYTDYAKIAQAYGAKGIKIGAANEFKGALQGAIESNEPTVIDVSMKNNPTPTTGHWNILDIYSPGQDISHVSTD